MDKTQLGGGMFIETFFGTELSNMSREKLRKIAQCYVKVFNESWQESWTEETALTEIQEVFLPSKGRTPVASFLMKDNDVVGFSWGILVDDTSYLKASDMPHLLNKKAKKRGVKNIAFWITNIMKRKKSFIYKELGVIKELRGTQAPLLSLPLFKKAFDGGYEVGFLWTKNQSRAYRWGLGISWTPTYLFAESQEIILAGLTKKLVDIAGNIVQNNASKKSMIIILRNQRKYLGV